jgi:hypothetical protein
MSTRPRQPRGLAEATASGEMAATYSPDGLTFEAITDLQCDVERELRRERLAEPTSWMSMSDTERHRIRPSLPLGDHRRLAGHDMTSLRSSPQDSILGRTE